MANGTLTERGSSILLGYLLQETALPTVTPYFGLATATPSKTSFTEITGSGYSRAAADATFFEVPTTGATTSLKDITFSKSTGYTGSVYGVGLFESAIATDPLVYWEASDIETIKLDDAYQIVTGGLDFSFTAASQMSTWLQNAIINYLFRGTPLAITGSSFDMAYCTTSPNATSFGTEPTGNGYVRQSVARGTASFDVVASLSAWKNDLQFPYATADQGNVLGVGYFDGAQYLMWGTASSATINTNSAYVIAAGTTISID